MRPRLKALLIILCFASTARAEEAHDFFIRSGMFSGSYNGKDLASGTYSTDINFETELWLYRDARRAWTFRVMLANESSLGRTRYFGAGTGQRYFLFNDGVTTEQQFGGDRVRVRPHLSFYMGWDAGLGQFLVLPFGSVLSAYATTADVAAVAGLRKSISDSFAIDALLGYTYSTSVLSSTSVTATSLRLLLGFGFSF